MDLIPFFLNLGTEIKSNCSALDVFLDSYLSVWGYSSVLKMLYNDLMLSTDSNSKASFVHIVNVCVDDAKLDFNR
jgi:hypothetical protein